MKRVLSGVKPTGDLTIGNYIGAMRHWPSYQQASGEGETLYFVADLHSLNTRQDPAELRSRSLDLVAWLVTMGVDPKRSSIFVQSMVSAHAELGVIFENYVTMGELSRMTQYKDKAQKTGSEGLLAGLFTYPALMAADILLYDADEVPVGDDQVQHIELTRDIAERFNNLYGQTFKAPNAITAEFGARIMSLDDPSRKMSKSEPNSYILLLDSPADIRQKIARAVTDSGNELRSGADKPAITNLIHIYAAFSEQAPTQIEQEFVGKGYGEFKQALADLLVDKITTLQTKFKAVRSDESGLNDIIRDGNNRASELADVKLAEVKQKVGLL